MHAAPLAETCQCRRCDGTGIIFLPAGADDFGRPMQDEDECWSCRGTGLVGHGDACTCDDEEEEESHDDAA